MKSLQLSLIVYFSALLAVALGAASWLVYRQTETTLQEKQLATAELLHNKYEQDCKKERDKIDEELLAQARLLAQLVQYHTDWSRVRNWDLNPLGALVAAQSPNAFANIPLWLAEGVRGRMGQETPAFSWELYRSTMAKANVIKLKNSALLNQLDDRDDAYFQVNSAWGASYHSQSLKGRTFVFDRKVFEAGLTIDREFDDYKLDSTQTVRRVQYKAPYITLNNTRPPGGGKRPGGSQPPPMPPNEPVAASQPAVFIQYAIDTSARDANLALLKANLDEELRQHDRESKATLANLKTRLLWMCALTFIATLVGTCVLVRLGLSPLRRLSEAVSQVSEKDFRLPFGEQRLPAELSPIVEHLNITLGQLKRAFAREKQAAADISHELRTPLAALMTTIEVTLRKPRAAEDYRQSLEDCGESAQQISHAVERLLALARLDAGVDTLRPQAIDATQLAGQCIDLVRPLAQARGIELALHADQAVTVNTDADKLREVLTNLLHNAITYNRPQGRIDVKVARVKNQVCLQVKDTGIGISSTAQAHIFERFYREDPSRKSDGMNTGLGLAIVKGYVDLMGGHVGVQSTEGQGSTFEVQLPA